MNWNYFSSLLLQLNGMPRCHNRRSDIDGSAIVLTEFRTIYIPIPKVACTSLKKAFGMAIGLDLSPVESGAKSIHQIDFPCIHVSEVEKFKNYKKIAFVRNPWDRLVSCYRDKVRENKQYTGRQEKLFIDGVHRGLVKYGTFRAGMSFDEFAQAVSQIPDEDANPHFRSQFSFLTNKNDSIFTDFTGKFESLNEDFNRIFEQLNIPDITLPHANKSRRAKYIEYYNDDLKELVKKRYSRDIEAFNYTF
ncbi:MAG: sulfotransferase family protein [Leptolyngbyaceae cyanobacterium]